MSLRLHAIYLTLADGPFLEASILSVYDHVTGITVGTTYDRDWQGRPAQPEGALVERLRALDAQRKIEVVVLRETNEARARNRLMDLVASPSRVREVPQHDGDMAPDPPDYFLIVDPDELWEAESLERLRAHAASDRGPRYRAGAVRYFRSWNVRVEGLEWSTVLVRSDRRLDHLRNWRVGLARRVAGRVSPRRLRAALVGSEDVPADVAVFHHGSYVGDRARIERKLASFGHAAEVRPRWLTEVWDQWTPDTRDFHPVWPSLFPASVHVATSDLPSPIRSRPWPRGWIE
ncbi:MAG TPA: hypothetical protein VFV35_01755 [Acidimicrobiales bacterium]|nr:hypothetical protein [Acidimicrobiales bacterium]